MASLRRHLASLGLAVVLCHAVMQILVPAALCCQKPLPAAGSKAEAHECCPMGSHPGQICPMHGKRGKATSDDRDCAARPLVDLHDMLMTLSNGGIIPTLMVLDVPARSDAAPAILETIPAFVPSVPPGPPPRA